MNIEDIDARQRAIDPNTSFIVQAPAGSGKTGLLTQRFLKLLSVVKEPEEIIAITFTRKAASEMHERIMHALKNVSELLDSPHDYERETGKLAQLALDNNQKHAWNLFQQSNRLKVQTIDSLCSDLSRQMPLLSQFGAIPNIIQDPSPLYLEAASEALEELETNSIYADAITHLLKHLDNRLDKLQQLIAQMLAKREQWLRHIVKGDIQKEAIEEAILDLVKDAIIEVDNNFPKESFLGLESKLIDLINFAANNVDSKHPLASCRDLKHFPSLDENEPFVSLKQLNAIVNWLMTAASSKSLSDSQRSWRKRVTKSEGFPAPSSIKDKQQKELFTQKKEQMLLLLSEFSESDNNKELANWLRSLTYLSYLPNTLLSDPDWLLLKSLFTVLVRSVAHLTVVFSRHGEVDYSEISLSAKRALGDEEQPTDLSLRLEHKIGHLLVDEFQDTSQNQFDLFKQLTAGWQTGDGHSLFIVGDPMQSIYRFREAEVGLFLKAWEYGLGDVQLQPLKLTVNFRSQAGIIDWVNQSFSAIFPAHDEINKGAVSYSASVAFRERLPYQAVHYFPYLERQDEKEAQDIIEIIKDVKDKDPEASVAVLVRNRTHLKNLIELLQEQKNKHNHKQLLAFQAVEIERLAQVPMIQDLLMLTRAILNLDDRIAWFAVLRAPYIGLKLTQLEKLSKDKTVLFSLLNQNIESETSKKYTEIIDRVAYVLNQTIRKRDSFSLRESIENCWSSLGGATSITTESEKENIKSYFNLLSSLDGVHTQIDINILVSQVNKLYSQADLQTSGSEQIQLMTIHKSKGLEFDHVILPGLARLPKIDDPQLLYWLESLNSQGDSSLLFSSINSSDGYENKQSTFIKLFEKEKAHIENTRLLYVAATRAKKQLYLMWHYKFDEKSCTVNSPDKNCLLSRMWPIVKDISQQNCDLTDVSTLLDDQKELIAYKINQTRQRLVRTWQCPIPQNISINKPNLLNADVAVNPELVPELLFDWASDTARIIGLVVHRILEWLGSNKGTVENNQHLELDSLLIKAKTLLQPYALSNDDANLALKQISKAMSFCLSDPKAQWIFSTKHQYIENELSLTGVIDQKIKHIIIDRTFVDENNIRWIIDYKTGAHQGGGLSEFLKHEQERYQQQLDHYALIYSQLENRPIKKALYFPMIPAWIEC